MLNKFLILIMNKLSYNSIAASCLLFYSNAVENHYILIFHVSVFLSICGQVIHVCNCLPLIPFSSQVVTMLSGLIMLIICPSLVKKNPLLIIHCLNLISKSVYGFQQLLEGLSHLFFLPVHVVFATSQKTRSHITSNSTKNTVNIKDHQKTKV